MGSERILFVSDHHAVIDVDFWLNFGNFSVLSSMMMKVGVAVCVMFGDIWAGVE